MFRLSLMFAAVAVCLASVASVSAAPKPGKVLRKIKNPVKGSDIGFGRSVAELSGIPLIGAPYDSEPVGSAGAIYIIWSKKDYYPIRNPNAVLGDNLGLRISRSNAYVASGLWNRDAASVVNSGAVVILNAITGEVSRTIENPAPGQYDSFGSDVALEDTLLVIGSLEDDNHGEDVGSAFVYNRETGVMLSELAPETTHTAQYFGEAVAISPNYIAVSATGENGNEGAIHLFDRNTHAFVRKISNPEPDQSQILGAHMACNGNTLAVGCATGLTTETVYLFDMNSGDLLHTLRNPSSTPFEHYGVSIASLGSNYFAVGAPFAYNRKGVRAGAVYVFDATTGALVLTVQDPAKKDGDAFGRSVSSFGEDLLVGSPGFKDGEGRAYVINGPE